LIGAPILIKPITGIKTMSVEQIHNFSEKARADAALAGQLKSCQKLKDMFALAKDNGFTFCEDDLYPPNEAQFTEDQLSERLVKALLRV
jgi:predicted ribosomally synthesized peptide with nif11-like leader